MLTDALIQRSMSKLTRKILLEPVGKHCIIT